MATTILAIDDDIAITELIAALLRTHGFDVLTANNGADGIQLIRERNPHIVILDLMMPGMDGWLVCKTVRTFTSVPILVLSALDDPSMVANALDAGADDYLVKPVPSSILIAHVNKLIRRTGALNPSKLESSILRSGPQSASS